MHSIHHLYSRAGFGLSPHEWQERRSWSTNKGVDELLKKARKARVLPDKKEAVSRRPDQMSREERLAFIKERRLQVARVNVDWIGRMANPEEPALLERMCLFWHGHFACSVKGGVLAGNYLNTLRRHALGNFGDLLKGIARDPAMIRYLNNQQNRKESPNENFARELLELFTLGHGQYTEQDIKEAARAFTGWASNLQGEFQFRPFHHDFGSKEFMGKRGRFNGDDIIDIILEQEQTARFITGKVYRYFVHPDGHEHREAELARRFHRSGYDIGDLMEYILRSDWFYALENRQVQVKSPVVLIAGLMRILGLQFDDPLPIIYVQRLLGQTLFQPPNVAGWPGGSTWIDNATLMNRLNLAGAMIRGSQLPGRAKDNLKAMDREESPGKLQVKSDMRPLIKLGRAPDRQTALHQLTEYLLPGMNVPESLIERFSKGENPQEEIAFAAVRLLSMPEFQLC